MYKFKRKIHTFIVRRRAKRLGPEWAHLAECHPSFSMERTADGHRVFWKKKEVGFVRNMQAVKGTGKGPCFLVATGPSMKGVNLEEIRGHQTISFNGAINLFLEKGMKPDHVLIPDVRIFEYCFEFIEKSVRSGANCFFSHTGLSRICERNPNLLNEGRIFLIEPIDNKYDQPLSASDWPVAPADAPHGVYMSAETPDTRKRRGIMGFCCDADQGFFFGRTVAYLGVQLAHWLGNHPIFILGMDLGGTGTTHCYAGTANGKSDFLRYYEPEIRVPFEIARQAAEAEHFSIYNLSEHSTLPSSIIPKITLKEALAIAKEVKK
jgi:KDO transferase-3